MTEKKQVLDIDKQVHELTALKPISVTFKGKPREVHFFHRGTAEAFSGAQRHIGKREYETTQAA